MMRIIALLNQKGGVGKTTTAVNLATCMAAMKKKTLLIDLDPQGNASTSFGILNKDRECNIYGVIIDKYDIEKAIIKTKISNLDIICANVDLAAADIELPTLESWQQILSKKLSGISEDYEYIFIDCPPSLGALSINALVAVGSIIIPLQCEFFALEGLSHLMKTIDLAKESLNKDLEIEGVIMTMYDEDNEINRQIKEDISKNEIADKVYKTIIPRNSKISESPSHGKPAVVYDMKCLGSVSYMHLAREILKAHNAL